MKPGANHCRLVVDQGGNWRQFVAAVPTDAKVIGVVSHPDLTQGALVRFPNGNYVQINGETVRQLDGRRVVSALGISGRRPEMSGGRKVNTYLDEDSISIAARLGDGNVSCGIRRALQECRSVGLNVPSPSVVS